MGIISNPTFVLCGYENGSQIVTSTVLLHYKRDVSKCLPGFRQEIIFIDSTIYCLSAISRHLFITIIIIIMAEALKESSVKISHAAPIPTKKF